VGCGVGGSLRTRWVEPSKNGGRSMNLCKWPPNFHPHEFLVSGGAKQAIRTNAAPFLWPRLLVLAWQLQIIRDVVGRMKIISGYRMPAYNRALPGAAKNSYHMAGMAADWIPLDCSAMFAFSEIQNILKRKGEPILHDGGLHLYTDRGGGRPDFIHYDIGPKRRW
jgi:uncharacterized protein YcbK (DUF882 family)